VIARRALLAAGLGAAALLAGCASGLRPAEPMVAPYDRMQLWAVVPPRNESGTSLVDPLVVADELQREAEQVVGVRTVPVNRVVQAMRELDLPVIDSAFAARTLMVELGLDALVTGTVTAYDPYRPMTFGLALDLHVRPALAAGPGALDPRTLEWSVRGAESVGETGPAGPAAQASAVFRASDHRTLKWVSEYADHRSEPESAFGDEIYLVSMKHFLRFACHRLLLDLLDQERMRLAAASVRPPT